MGKKTTQPFSFHLEQKLIELQVELREGRYQPAPYRYFKIYDPKERMISVAEFRDRVVHHALINLLEPIYEKTFIHDSYATRKNKGTHLAVRRAQTFLKTNEWFFKTDIDKYFDSINHDILMTLLSQKIKDQSLLKLTDLIIRNANHNGVGLPIGNLTSQFFANVYLNQFDHFVKRELKVRRYIRYMDDFVLFHSDKDQVKAWRDPVGQFLKHSLRLNTKEKGTFLNHRQNGLTFLGRRIFPKMIRLARPNARRMTKRMHQRAMDFQNGKYCEEKYVQSMNSYWAQLEPFGAFRRNLLEG